MLDRELSLEERWCLEQNLKDVFFWLRNTVHWLAVYKAISIRKKSSRLYLAELAADYSGLAYKWSQAYGYVRVMFSFDSKHFHHVTEWIGNDKWFIYQVLGRDRDGLYKKDFLLALYVSIDKSIRTFFPNITQENGIRFCSICSGGSRRIAYRLPPNPLDPLLDTCFPIGDKWVCEYCLGKFSLSPESQIDPQPKPVTFAEKERAKMSVTLRYSILERDGFCCVGCGRGKDDGIKLHVDHKIPIANGGTTEPDNLHTLCQDCNFGKGVRDWIKS